jgi:hypothetical protein
MIALLLLATVSPEALDLGQRLATTGTLSTIAPLLTAKETDEIIVAHPELSDEDKTSFRASARATGARLRARLIVAEGKAFAENLSVEDLRVLVRQAEAAPAARMRAAMPKVMAGFATMLGKLDFKGEAISDFCASRGKLCARPK